MRGNGKTCPAEVLAEFAHRLLRYNRDMQSPPKPAHARAIQYIALARSTLVTLLGLMLVFRAAASADPTWRVAGSALAFALVLLGTLMGARAIRRLQQLRAAPLPPNTPGGE